MAWQLIYTSAPRLLEAGRSGFGTVARHRAIHPTLAAALERDSQFDRSAVRGRVVFAHRIITAGGARFHVLSCIRETGADYTGRTNHIAHHLIIDPREVSLLGSAAPSPMDICREMTWRTAWTDAPKWLDASEEISVSQFHPAATPGNDWQAIAGDGRYAGVLRPTTSYALILPPAADALALFAESGTVAASQSWQATFTTCIQPTDDLSEFRWVAVEAVSPVRERTSGGRAVLDLTAPETLPAPPESRSKLFIPAPDKVLPTPSSLAEKSKAKPVGNLFDDQLAVHAPSVQKRDRRKSGLLPYIIALVVLGGAAIYCGMVLFTESPELVAQRTKVREDVNAAFPGTGMETAQTLSQVSKEQLPAALAIARTARESHEALQRQTPLPEINAEQARAKAKAVNLNIPQPIGLIFDLYSTHFEFQQRVEKVRNLAPAASQLEQLSSVWKDVDQSSDAQAKQLRERTMKNIESLWAERLLAVLKTDPHPTNADWFDNQLNSLPASLRESKDAKSANENAKKLIKDWRAVDAAGDDEKKLKELLAEGRSNWPGWLTKKANAKIENKPKQVGIPGPPQNDTPKPENVAATSASKPFEGDLIIVTNPTSPEEWGEFAKELAAGNYELFVKGKPNPLSGAETGNFRFGAGNTAFNFNKKEKSFQATTEGLQRPYQLELRRDRKVVLSSWVPKPGEPFHEMEGGLVRKDNEIKVKDSLGASLCQLAQRRGWALTLASAEFSVAIDGDGKASIAQKVEALKKDIEKQRASLDLMEKIRDGKAFPVNLETAIADMVKYTGDAGFPRPKDDAKIKDQYKEEKEKSNRDKALAENERLRNAVERPSPNDPVSLGFFLQLASNKPLNSDPLEKIGKEIEDKKYALGSEKFDTCIANALAEIRKSEKELNAQTQFKSYSNNKEKQQRERERNEAKRDLDMVQRLEAFLVAIQTLPAIRESAKAEIPKTLQEIDSRLKHPLLHADLPPGEYTISVTPPASANRLPFIRFTISKP